MSGFKVPPVDAYELAQEHHAHGRVVAGDAQLVMDEKEYRAWAERHNRWKVLAEEALRYMFDGETEAEQLGARYRGMIYIGAKDWESRLRVDESCIYAALQYLEDVIERASYAMALALRPDAYAKPAGDATTVSRVRLKVTRTEAEKILAKHFEEGDSLREKAVQNDQVVIREEEEYRDWRLEQQRWIRRTKAALAFVYADDEPIAEFERVAEPPVFVGPNHWTQSFEHQYEDVGRAMNVLQSHKESLEYDDEPTAAPATPATAAADPTTETEELVIFLVHGRDHGTRETVARFLERTGPHGLRPLILDELANKGRTLVEKLEQHASESRYSVVLLTGDDVGGVKGADRATQQPRARQNVILELGWFCGEIGRKNVAVLYEEGVELPSDVDGLAYIPLDGDWQKDLVNELRDAGWDFRLDRLSH